MMLLLKQASHLCKSHGEALKFTNAYYSKLIDMKKKIFSSLLLSGLFVLGVILMSSSHREAPMIANDPLADNTDLYAFRSPDNPDMITIIANYIPLELPHGGPNYYSFGENVRYEI